MNELFDQTVSETTIDETKDFLSELVGDGKKFKDVKDLAKGKAFSDAHIANLEKSLDQMRAELQTRKTAEELIDKISQRRNPDPTPSGDTRLLDDDTQSNIKSGLKSRSDAALTPEDVERMFLEREARRRKDDNLTLATQKLKEIHGDAAAAALQTKARELGLDAAYLKNMAQEAPNAFLALFSKSVDQTKDIFNAPPSSSFRTQMTAPSLTEKWSNFNEVKKSNPRLYESPAYQRKIMEAGERAAQAGRFEEFMST